MAASIILDLLSFSIALILLVNFRHLMMSNHLSCKIFTPPAILPFNFSFEEGSKFLIIRVESFLPACSYIKNFSTALSAYDQESKKIAQSVPEEDITINSIYETCFREHLHLMMEDRDIIGFCTQMLFIAKELERIGDLSKVISKEVIYNLQGTLK